MSSRFGCQREKNINHGPSQRMLLRTGTRGCELHFCLQGVDGSPSSTDETRATPINPMVSGSISEENPVVSVAMARVGQIAKQPPPVWLSMVPSLHQPGRYSTAVFPHTGCVCMSVGQLVNRGGARTAARLFHVYRMGNLRRTCSRRSRRGEGRGCCAHRQQHNGWSRAQARKEKAVQITTDATHEHKRCLACGRRPSG